MKDKLNSVIQIWGNQEASANRASALSSFSSAMGSTSAKLGFQSLSTKSPSFFLKQMKKLLRAAPSVTPKFTVV